MFEALNNLIQQNILTTIGLLIAVVFLGSKLFQRVGIPQVVGFIVVGAFLGPSFLNLIPLELSEDLAFISEIALGLIGFDIGSHLLFEDLRDLGRSILFTLLFEAIGTFVLVTTGVYLITRSLPAALIFGALSSATAPAATVDVLAEYDAQGPLTTSLLAVVGLDDAAALILYSIAATVSVSLLGGSSPSLLSMVGLPLIEIGGSVALGLALGLLLNQILWRMKTHHDDSNTPSGYNVPRWNRGDGHLDCVCLSWRWDLSDAWPLTHPEHHDPGGGAGQPRPGTRSTHTLHYRAGRPRDLHPLFHSGGCQIADRPASLHGGAGNCLRASPQPRELRRRMVRGECWRGRSGSEG